MGHFPYSYLFFICIRFLKPNSLTDNSLRFLCIILRILRLEVSVYIVYITNQFKATFTTFDKGGGGIIL
jgi:hypothetical protein